MKKGMTLIELVVYIGLVAIVMLVIADLATHLVLNQAKNNGSQEVQANLELISTKLINSIENAHAATGSYPSDQLNLTTATGTEVYSLSGNVFQISKNGAAAIPISNSKVVISPPSGGKIFTKVTNGTDTSVKINLVVSLVTDVTKKETFVTTILAGGK